jgi:hypothetical protein
LLVPTEAVEDQTRRGFTLECQLSPIGSEIESEHRTLRCQVKKVQKKDLYSHDPFYTNFALLQVVEQRSSYLRFLGEVKLNSANGHGSHLYSLRRTKIITAAVC